MPDLEVTPLLADPPIDDDSYRYEARSFPNGEQKHAIYVAYVTTALISRYCEMAATLVLAMTYTSSLYPLTFYSFAVLSVSAWSDRITTVMARPFTSRLGLLTFTVAQQRLAMILFFVLVLLEWQSPESSQLMRCARITGIALTMIWLKTSLALYQTTFRWDWLRMLANNQENVRLRFETGIHGMSTVSQLVFPMLAGVMAQRLSVVQCCYVVIFGATLGLLVELSVIYKLYSSCYALHLARTPYTPSPTEQSLEQGAMIGVLTTPLMSGAHSSLVAPGFLPFSSRPLSRIVKYIRRKPVPVIATFGAVLTNVSLITVGPHVVWYLLRKDASPIYLGFLKMLQTFVTLRPFIAGWQSFVVGATGTVLSISLLAVVKYDVRGTLVWAHLLGFAIVLARSGVPGITQTTEQFVADYLADDGMLKLYKEGASLLQIESELIIHVLALVWPHESQFLWPMSVSAALSLTGTCAVVYVLLRLSRKEGTVAV